MVSSTVYVLIEFISYLARNVSLGLRLAASKTLKSPKFLIKLSKGQSSGI
ncbi:hypothetical protein GCM10023339_68980 [Alloalcanivorax gelatiniphagus]